ncbi:MAG: nucleotidyltransferase domain-containing protein, partial [Prevotella sp.]|nr:nucleotidyltransferase domain-containing protein [Prevotella sp.]
SSTNVRVFAFDRQVFAKGWDPSVAFDAMSSVSLAEFVSSHRLGEHEKLSLLVTDNHAHIFGNVFLPWNDLRQAATDEGTKLIARYILQMGGSGCVIYGSSGALNLYKQGTTEVNYSTTNAIHKIQKDLALYFVKLYDVVNIDLDAMREYRAKFAGLLLSYKDVKFYDNVSREVAIEDADAVEIKEDLHEQKEQTVNTRHVSARRLTPEDREAGGALVDQLEAMGIEVSTDGRTNRKVLKESEKDKSVNGRVRYMRTSDGRNYGFTYDGKLFMDLRYLDAELPLHEYSHLWCEAMRKLSPDSWQSVKDVILNDFDTLRFVREAYPDIKDDDHLVEEVVATYSGRKGAEKIRAELERMSKRDDGYKSRWSNIFGNISKAVQDFWKKTGDFLNMKYMSADEIADQILKDFASKVSPVKKMERYLQERDAVYADAVSNDPDLAALMVSEALEESVGNGITPVLAVGSYKSRLGTLARNIKTGDEESIEKAAELIAPLISFEVAVLVPAPSHDGHATDMLKLCEAISRISGHQVLDILEGDARESQREVKLSTGVPLTAKQLGIRLKGELPFGVMPVVIDNVVNSGNTAEACIQALGRGVVVALSSAVSHYRHAASLRSAAYVAYDRKGDLIPLSKRFRFYSNKYVDNINYNIKPMELEKNYDPETVQGLEKYSVDKIKTIVRDYVNEVFSESYYDTDAEIVNITVVGSRSRGEAHEGSDLDILLEYSGDVKEDGLFDALHDPELPLEIDGIKVDINPINPRYSLTTEQWMERDAKWRVEDRMKATVKQSPLDKLTAVLSEDLPDVGDRLDFDRGFMADDDIGNQHLDIIVKTLKHVQDGFMAGNDDEGYLYVNRFTAQEQDYMRFSLFEKKICDLIGSQRSIFFEKPLEVVEHGETDTRVFIYELSADNGDVLAQGAIEESGEKSIDDLEVIRLSADGMQSIHDGFAARMKEGQDIVGNMVKEFYYLFASALVLKDTVNTPSSLYDLLDSMSRDDYGEWSGWAQGAWGQLQNAVAVPDAELKKLYDETGERLTSFLHTLAYGMSSDQVDMFTKALREQRTENAINGLYDQYYYVLNHYERHNPSGELSEDLLRLLTVGDGKQLLSWANSTSAYADTEQLAGLKNALSRMSLYDAEQFVGYVQRRAEEPENAAVMKGKLPKTRLQEYYSVVVSYYLSNRDTLPVDVRKSLSSLEKAVTADDLMIWASGMRVGNTSEIMKKMNNDYMFSQVEELSFIIAESREEDLAQLAEGEGLGLLNDQRLDCLYDQLQTLREEHPDEMILLRNGDGTTTAYGSDAINISVLTGWEGSRIVDATHNGPAVVVTSDGYNVLSDKDVNLRIVTPDVNIRPFVAQWRNEICSALQTIDYNILYVEDKPVIIDTDDTLNIGDFKAKTLDFRPTGLDAIDEKGDKLVIRDIPTNFYHPEGTLVVASYINGHRETIENILDQQPSDIDEEGGIDILDHYHDVKLEHPDELLLLQQKGFLEAFGKDAERLATTFGTSIYDVDFGGDKVKFATISLKDYMALSSEASVDIFVAQSRVRDSRQAISQRTVRMEDSVAVDPSKKDVAAQVYRLGDGSLAVVMVHPVTLMEKSDPVKLSVEDAARYMAMSGADGISQRSDFVLEMADKYLKDFLYQNGKPAPLSPYYQNLVKGALVDMLSKYNSSYYNIEGFDLSASAMLDNIHDVDDARLYVSELCRDLLEQAEAKESGIMKRLLPVDMTLDDEVSRMTDEMISQLSDVIDIHSHHIEDRMHGEAVELSKLQREFNKLKAADDVNFMFRKPVESYRIKPQEDSPYNTHFALKSVNGDEEEYVTSWISYQDVEKQMDAIRADIIKEYPVLGMSDLRKEIDDTRAMIAGVGLIEYPLTSRLPVVINIDEFVAKDVVDGITVKEDGTLVLNGRRIDEAGVSASYTLEGREEYDLADIDKMVDAIKWEMSDKSRKNQEEKSLLAPPTEEQWQILKDAGYPYVEGGSKEHSVPDPSEMIYWRYAVGMITFDEAVKAFSSTGCTVGENVIRAHEILSEFNLKYDKLLSVPVLLSYEYDAIGGIVNGDENFVAQNMEEEQFEFFLHDYETAIETVMDMNPLTDRQYGMLLAASEHLGGVQELADQLNMDVDYLRSALRMPSPAAVLQRRFDEFVQKNGEEPLYAEVTVRYKDDDRKENVLIKIGITPNEDTDERIFFSVCDFEDLKKLSEKDMEDFVVVDINDVVFHSKTYLESKEYQETFDKILDDNK